MNPRPPVTRTFTASGCRPTAAQAEHCEVRSELNSPRRPRSPELAGVDETKLELLVAGRLAATLADVRREERPLAASPSGRSRRGACPSSDELARLAARLLRAAPPRAASAAPRPGRSRRSAARARRPRRPADTGGRAGSRRSVSDREDRCVSTRSHGPERLDAARGPRSTSFSTTRRTGSPRPAVGRGSVAASRTAASRRRRTCADGLADRRDVAPRKRQAPREARARARRPTSRSGTASSAASCGCVCSGNQNSRGSAPALTQVRDQERHDRRRERRPKLWASPPSRSPPTSRTSGSRPSSSSAYQSSSARRCAEPLREPTRAATSPIAAWTFVSLKLKPKTGMVRLHRRSHGSRGPGP